MAGEVEGCSNGTKDLRRTRAVGRSFLAGSGFPQASQNRKNWARNRLMEVMENMVVNNSEHSIPMAICNSIPSLQLPPTVGPASEKIASPPPLRSENIPSSGVIETDDLSDASADSGACRVTKASKSEASRARRKLAMLKRSGLFGNTVQGATIERACSLADLREAYALVHEVYAETGYIRPATCRLRMRMFETSPEMATFIAKVGGRVIGVLSIVGDSLELGLPSDAAFKPELDDLRSKGSRLCEVTNQAVAERHRKSAVATELMRCAMAHTTEAGYDENVAAVSPGHSGFYRLLNFRQIGTERSYSTKIHDPVVALSMDVNQYRRTPDALDEAELFMHHFLAGGNQYLKHVGRWAIEAQRCFFNQDLLRRLFITETSFITTCSRSQLEVLEQQWGRRLFATVTGESLSAVFRNWFSAFLNVLHLRNDESDFGGLRRAAIRASAG